MLSHIYKLSVVAVALFVAGCSSSTISSGDSDGASPVTCAWPMYLDPDSGLPGNESGLCTAHRYFFTCTGNGVDGICVSDFPDAAQSSECAELGTGFSCEKACNADEYVVVCNSFNAVAPISSCRQVKADPEQEYFCCECIGEPI
jgi:hypothetical protein